MRLLDLYFQAVQFWLLRLLLRILAPVCFTITDRFVTHAAPDPVLKLIQTLLELSRLAFYRVGRFTDFGA